MESIRTLEVPHAWQMAEVYACWSDSDRAFDWLERAYREHDPFLRHLRHPMMENLRADPRWDDLARRVGVADADAARVRLTRGNECPEACRTPDTTT